MKTFNAAYITRTVVYTSGKAVKANLETMEMETFDFILVGTFKASELKEKLMEKYGDSVVGFKNIEVWQEKRRISVDDFIRYSEQVTAKEDTGE